MELHEARYSSRLSSRHRALCLRPHLPDSLDHQRRDAARGNLLELPSFFHRQAKTRGHRRSCRALPKEIRRRRRKIHRRQKVKSSSLGRKFRAPYLLVGYSPPLNAVILSPSNEDGRRTSTVPRQKIHSVLQITPRGVSLFSVCSPPLC